MTLFSVLAAVGSNWKGSALTCHFSGTADGVPLAVADDTKPIWIIPTTATTVTITARPTVPTYWPTTVNFDVDSATGALTPTGDTVGFVTVHALGALGVQLSLASVNLSRFKDVSDDVLKLLDPPATRKEMAKTYKETYGVWRPPDWTSTTSPTRTFSICPCPRRG